MDKNIGKKLDGRYEITELIGVGGMADVYKATDVVDHKTVAVKILKKEFAENEEFLRRFRNESKAIAVLSHPNIVKIYDVGFSDKIQYIVMEYIDGITLKEYMETEKVLSWKDSVHFVLQILRALQHAHSRGIVHRDIKPQNIMMFPDGTIKVMDFGIAKFAREQGKTATDQAIGTVHYISPEQARGDVTDAKSDVYSVGVMLYEMLTGKKPFDTDNPVTIAVMHMQSTAERPRSINPDIPIGLEEIILHAMVKDPAHRYQTAQEMIRDIEQFKENPDIVFGYHDDEEEPRTSDSPTRFFNAVTPSTAEIPAMRDNQGDEEDYEESDEDEYDDEDEEDEEERRSLFVPILTGVTIAVIVAAVILVTYLIVGWLNGDNQGSKKEFAMPNLIGTNYQEAVDAWKGKLDLKVIASEYSEYEKDVIFYQSIPENDPISLNSVVEIKVSLGNNTIDVPDVIGWTETLATKTLSNQGLTVEVKKAASDTVEKGLVCETVPAAGESIAPNSKILVYISMGPNASTVEVPNFTSKTLEEAKLDAEVLKLELQATEVDSSEPAGQIVYQSINAGEQVVTGTIIEVKVSNGIAPVSKCNVTFALPENATGSFYFTFYDGGAVFYTSPVINAEYTSGSATVTLEGSGTKELIVSVTNSVNKQTARIGTYAVDFDKKTASARSDVNVQAAFKNIGAVVTPTEPPVVTTQPPVVTTQPPVVTTQAAPEVTEPATNPAEDPNAGGE
ncbi:Stk1 family PASTA domain-containing Ser/Thr kinase [Ruminococcus sp.]|uniref:Stk1 family PASTA domain-containing Ser/Thr kinase n=1 Tax=Ruminococcus sp. TaxID=41978 RepID=UPI0025E18C7F|nr:Stk1 family PASTA domain-containing Ser/Thr kinase [Ruminococcus sp.]MDD7556777.1 Stk1 family PASTA domain-containing Ser/Thr kinase [Ruminococcus sp.]MDY4963076.1 Stk1 family PASTA domain-containing Ser/Thr kinase [Ruminococcus callidus]